MSYFPEDAIEDGKDDFRYSENLRKQKEIYDNLLKDRRYLINNINDLKETINENDIDLDNECIKEEIIELENRLFDMDMDINGIEYGEYFDKF
jgi:hypothetical protein